MNLCPEKWNLNLHKKVCKFMFHVSRRRFMFKKKKCCPNCCLIVELIFSVSFKIYHKSKKNPRWFFILTMECMMKSWNGREISFIFYMFEKSYFGDSCVFRYNYHFIFGFPTNKEINLFVGKHTNKSIVWFSVNFIHSNNTHS